MQRSEPERFWEKVDLNGPIPDYAPHLGPCWLWTAAVNLRGYGRFAPRHGEVVLAHRWSCERVLGQIPSGLTIDHLCRVTGCVKPHHLEAVTCRTNLLRGDTITARNAAATHCPQGHAYDEMNTYHSLTRRGTPQRDCRACHRERERRRRSALSLDA